MTDWGTGITNAKKLPQEEVSVWGTQSTQQPVNKVNTQGTNRLETHHVSKPLPVFSTIFADHVEFNKYMKPVSYTHLTLPTNREV